MNLGEKNKKKSDFQFHIKSRLCCGETTKMIFNISAASSVHVHARGDQRSVQRVDLHLSLGGCAWPAAGL